MISHAAVFRRGVFVMENKLLAAKIVNTHGIRGETKAVYYTDTPFFFENIKNVLLKPGDIRLCLDSFRAHKGAVLLKFSGIDKIEDAETLVGKEVWVDREESILPEGRYYIADIIGCAVFSEDGENMGEVTEVFETGSNDVFELARPNGKKAYIPNIKDIVKIIDVEAKKITIHLIGGLIDDED